MVIALTLHCSAKDLISGNPQHGINITIIHDSIDLGSRMTSEAFRMYRDDWFSCAASKVPSKDQPWVTDNKDMRCHQYKEPAPEKQAEWVKSYHDTCEVIYKTLPSNMQKHPELRTMIGPESEMMYDLYVVLRSINFFIKSLRGWRY
ncbi:hypothetical protein TREMEDRAFT_66581 [Tremella mesenterica DSM 1558]|uniref:uncharacterized protein n=1 Tax=Tremella mesenterica (strain ATCC 24925 / CBS 8224 / DSM 1558 / NBRC 9311 / NRRL Y-6157 / RJB 2259-6 / UBC 559-6) TaxID=578456 RepID=UPI00032C8BAF|nr:uncharacterized protein TREMEDRAFT_66581 [Tremella mesenterica DSM 1558]EIW65448.1 hypothetical protein TREMEDRAFT_66581 [Tremella mesenterica DSM 1558]